MHRSAPRAGRSRQRCSWPGENAVGKRLQVQPTGSPNAFVEVVGVIEHIRSQDLARAVRPQIFRPLIGFGGTQPFVVVRTTVDPASLTPAIRQVVASMDPDAPVEGAQPMSAYVGDALAQLRLALLLLAGFGITALLMAAIGIYGVISYSVSQRTKEIGIRMALGQDAGQIRNLVVTQGLRLVAISLGIGLAAAYAMATTVSGLLYGINPRDPLTFAGMTVFLLAVALIGCLVPARSKANRWALASSPPANPVSLPFHPMTREHGAMIETGCLPFAAPTARTAPGLIA